MVPYEYGQMTNTSIPFGLNKSFERLNKSKNDSANNKMWDEIRERQEHEDL